MITLIHFYLFSILLQSYPFRPESTDGKLTKKMQLESSGKYEKLTELLHTPEKTVDQIVLNWDKPGEIIIFIYRHGLQRDH